MRSFTDIKHLSKSDIEAILFRTKQEKKVIAEKGILNIEKILLGKNVALIFEKPSTRTRVSFEVGISQLGGHSSVLQASDIQLSRGESISDTAKVLSEYVDIVMLRTSSHKNLEEFGKHLNIPIINGLSDLSHPCQIMSDILTYEESNGSIEDKTVCWIGDGNNNMSNSLIEAAGKFNFKLKIGCPKKYSPNKGILKLAKKERIKLTITSKPLEAVEGADCVMTDKWISMNDKVNKASKKKILKPYQVNKKLMSKANSDAIFMHCLPVGRGEEVTNEVIDGKQSVVWRQALNRVHAQKSIIKWCLD